MDIPSWWNDTLSGVSNASSQWATSTPIVVTAICVLVSTTIYAKRQASLSDKAYGKPDHVVAFSPLTLPSILFGLGLDFNWKQRFTLYRVSKREIVLFKSTLWGSPTYYTNSKEVLRQIGGSGIPSAWVKPECKGTLNWGRNIFAENDVEWKRHRRIMQPAYSPKTYELVWQEVTRLYNEMIKHENWPVRSGETISISVIQRISTHLALSTILSVGFGLPLPWADGNAAKAKHSKLSLAEGVRLQTENLILAAWAPKWVFSLPFGDLRRLGQGLDALGEWFRESIVHRKQKISSILHESAEDAEENVPRDVFSRIVLSNLSEGKYSLKDNEIIGNIWLLLFAGHETSAATIAGTLAFLAGYSIEQEIIFQEIREAVSTSPDGTLSFEDYNRLPKTRSAFVEATRMIPPGSFMLRESIEDTILQVPATDEDGVYQEENVTIPKGTVVVADVVGIHYNSRYFPEPDTYKPSRWYEATNDDVYTMFSLGPRACIGRKFALTEAVCFIANVIKDYEVKPLLQSNETLEQWRNRVLHQTKLTITLNMTDAPLIFKRR